MAARIIPNTRCDVDGCETEITTHPYCSKHYQRFRKHGSPNISLCDRESVICSVTGCEEPSRSKGYCKIHYVRSRKYGDPLMVSERYRRKLRWIEANYRHKGDDCLTWPFGVNDNGRGVVTIDQKNMSAPRAMCLMAHGEPPTPKHQASHSCGKGHLGCVNPNHLRWATAKENEEDKIEHGTIRRGTDINTSKLSEKDVVRIRSLGREYGVNRLANEYGVSPTAISLIHKRKNWGWLE